MEALPGLLPQLEVIRKDFPILERRLSGDLPLVYLDSANTSQKPQVVIDTMVDHLERHNANVARATRWSSPRTRPRRSTSWPTRSPGPPARSASARATAW